MTSLLTDMTEMDAAAELKAVQEGYHELRVRVNLAIKEPLSRIYNVGRVPVGVKLLAIVLVSLLPCRVSTSICWKVVKQ